MKKFLTLLVMITCIFGLTACGKETETVSYDEASVQSVCSMLYDTMSTEQTADILDQLNAMSSDDLASVVANFKQYGINISGDALIKGMESALSSKEDAGDMMGIESYDITADNDSVTAVMSIKGSVRNIKMEVLFDEEMVVESVTSNIQYSFGEQMVRAALNTVLGMGTTFAILILISLIISCFTFIPKIQERLTKKETVEEIKAVSVDNTIAQIVKNEELSDDSELVSVIAAAIAAYEGTTTDGFVVRSIKRSNKRNWQKA